jgi:hypothetical protein
MMEVSFQLHTPAALPPGKEPRGTHCTGGRVGPRAGLDSVEQSKMLPLPEFALRAVKPTARRYTDRAISALSSSSVV